MTILSVRVYDNDKYTLTLSLFYFKIIFFFHLVYICYTSSYKFFILQINHWICEIC